MLGWTDRPQTGKGGHMAPKSAEDTTGCGHSLGLAAGTEVLTLHGMLPVEYLTPGDRIITRDGVCSLGGVTVQHLQQAEVVRVGDLMLPPDQPLRLRGARTREPAGLLPAARLTDGDMIRLERVADLRMFRLHFARALVLYAGGLEAATLTTPKPAGT